MRWKTPCVAMALLALPSPGVAKDRSAPASPIGSPGDWFPVRSYPAEAKRNGEQGRVSIELAIDKSGVPKGCKVTGSSGSASLDAATCDLARVNGRFVPARDARGRPIESSFAVPAVRWELDDDYAHMDLSAGPVTQTLRSVEIVVDQQGKIVTCRSLANGGGGAIGCEGFRPGAGIVRPLIVNGKPVNGRITMTTTMRVEAK